MTTAHTRISGRHRGPRPPLGQRGAGQVEQHAESGVDRGEPRDRRDEPARRHPQRADARPGEQAEGHHGEERRPTPPPPADRTRQSAVHSAALGEAAQRRAQRDGQLEHDDDADERGTARRPPRRRRATLGSCRWHGSRGSSSRRTSPRCWTSPPAALRALREFIQPRMRPIRPYLRVMRAMVSLVPAASCRVTTTGTDRASGFVRPRMSHTATRARGFARRRRTLPEAGSVRTRRVSPVADHPDRRRDRGAVRAEGGQRDVLRRPQHVDVVRRHAYI